MKIIHGFVVIMCLGLLSVTSAIHNFPKIHRHVVTRRDSGIKAVRIDENGGLYAIITQKESLSKELNLRLRDLRLVDPSFTGCTFSARPGAVLLAFDHVNVAINHNKGIVFSDGKEESHVFLCNLQKRIQDIHATRSSKSFEHVVISTALDTINEALSRDVYNLQLKVYDTPHHANHDVAQRLGVLVQRVKEVQRVIKEVLDNDTALQTMHLTRNQNKLDRLSTSTVSTADCIAAGELDQDVHIEQSNDENHLSTDYLNDDTTLLELMLEEHLHKLGLLSAELSDLQFQADKIEQKAAMQRELLHQRRQRFELTLSMGSFVVSCAALVTGVFGMNLLSHVEHQPIMFWAVTASLVVGMFVTFGQLSNYGRHEKLF